MALENLTPVIRPEKILNGDAIAPVTRKEYFIQKGASGGGGEEAVLKFRIYYDTATESYKTDIPISSILTAIRSGILTYIDGIDPDEETDYYYFNSLNESDNSISYQRISALIDNDSGTFYGLKAGIVEINRTTGVVSNMMTYSHSFS